MSSLEILNSGAQNVRQKQSLSININAARSLQNLLKTNLGPRGTLKMLVGGGGDITVTKDGNVLLNNMQISHPTAALIARTAVSQDKITGDGTTSTVLITGELLYQAYGYLLEGVHPSAIIEGIEIGLGEAKNFLKEFSKKYKKEIKLDKEALINVAKTSLRTKLDSETADKLSNIVVDSVEIIKQEGKQLDLFMVEIQEMEHKLFSDTQFIKGIVLDHGARHPDMERDLKNCYILTCNVSLEYEKSDVNSKFVYSDAKNRQSLIEAERKVTDDKVKKIIELKKSLCDSKEEKDPSKKKNFVVINQKGIDPMSLDLLAKAGITALRRAKRRNMERLTLACGGKALNSLEDIKVEDLGFADHVYEVSVGDEKFTYVEGVKNPHSCTILIKGQNKFTITQIKDAIRDGLRAVKNAIEDDGLLPGAGAFEVALHSHLLSFSKKSVKGKPSIGVKCFAEALLVIPKTLATNSGLDPLDTLLDLQHEHESGNIVGLDVYTGDPIDPILNGIFDNIVVKQQILETSMYTASQLLHIDEIMASGRKKNDQQLN